MFPMEAEIPAPHVMVNSYQTNLGGIGACLQALFVVYLSPGLIRN